MSFLNKVYKLTHIQYIKGRINPVNNSDSRGGGGGGGGIRGGGGGGIRRRVADVDPLTAPVGSTPVPPTSAAARPNPEGNNTCKNCKAKFKVVDDVGRGR
jgi:hypothetical protein